MLKNLSLLTVALLIVTQLAAQVNLNSGLLVHYQFNGNFLDYSGNNRHGVQHGNVGFTTNQQGQQNRAAYFDGIDDWIECPASPQISPSKELTIAFRFKTDDIRAQTLLSKADFSPTQNNNVNNIQYGLFFNHYQSHGGRMGLLAASEHDNSCITSNFYASHNSYVAPTDTVFPNQWHCIVFVFDKGIKKMYDNGNLVIADTVPASQANPYSLDSCTIAPLKLATWWQNDPNFFKGTMDEFRLYNRALTAAEIAAVCTSDDGGDTTTSVNNSNGYRVSIYPNPAMHILNVDYSKNAPYNIVDVTGRVMQQGVLISDKTAIDISQLPKGTYIIQIHGQGILRSRFVKTE